METFIQKINNNEIFKFIKENFSLLIFIPSLLGGIRQFLSLLYYSPTLIQYFSFSQIIIDGIDVLLQLLYVLTINLVVLKIIQKKEDYIYYLQAFLALLVLITTIIYFCFFYSNDNIKNYNIVNHKENLFKILLLTVIALSVANNISSLKNYRSKKLSIAFFIISTLGIMYLFLAALFVKPFQYNVENLTEVINEIKHKKTKKAKLIYYNDSYLIFLLNPEDSSGNKKFYIKKFEDIFNEQNKDSPK
jgi:hypothetical protein